MMQFSARRAELNKADNNNVAHEVIQLMSHTGLCATVGTNRDQTAPGDGRIDRHTKHTPYTSADKISVLDIYIQCHPKNT